MPYDSSLVGTELGPFEIDVDAGWTMAYAAGIGDLSACYVDSLQSGTLVAHPVFPVCFVWNAMRAMDEKLIETSLTADERVRRVHATQCMVLHQAIRPPGRLTMKSTLIGVERRRPGAYVLMRHETRDSRGEPVATVYWGVIYRNVDVTGPDRPSDAPKMPSPPHWDGHLRAEFNIPIGAGLAHIYTACSRQGSPINIHTDTTVARRAGLPAPILMGTATLALSVSKIIVAEATGNPERVERIFGRFGAMVLMPSEITVRITTRAKVAGRETVFFETMSAEGGRAIRDGAVVLRN